MWISRLSPEQAGQVRALADRAEVADGTAALNEEARFAWGDDSARHFLARAGDELVGYLQWQPRYASAQLVVDPGHRREGIGRGLVAELERAVRTAAPAAGTPWAPATEPPWGLWAFGDRRAARGFAAALGLRPSRGLLMMARDALRA